MPLWLKEGYPFTVCTDDFGVFATTLSREYWHLATAFGLSRRRVLQIVRASAQYGFHRRGDKAAEDACAAVQAGCDALLKASGRGVG